MAYIGKTPITGNFVKLDAISVVNGQASYTMNNGGSAFTDYENVNQFLVSLNGILQAPTDSFTVSGSTLTFASNLATGDVIDFVIVLGNTLDIGTPSDATVTNAKTNFVSTSSSAGLQIKGDGTTDGTLQLNCSQNSHGIKLKSPSHASAQSYTLTFPTTSPATDKFLKTDSSGNLSFADAGGDNTPYFYVRKTSDQVGINHNTAVKATFDTEDLDSDSAYASDKFTVPSGEGGKYFLFASAPLLAYNVSKLRRAELMLYKNGSLLKRTYSDYQANDIQGSYQNVSGIFDLSASDYIETYVRIRTSDSGNSNYIQGSTSTTTVMGGYKLIG